MRVSRILSEKAIEVTVVRELLTTPEEVLEGAGKGCSEICGGAIVALELDLAVVRISSDQIG